MNKKITYDEFLEIEYKNIWVQTSNKKKGREIKDVVGFYKFYNAKSIGYITNFIYPKRITGIFLSLLAYFLWLMNIAILIFLVDGEIKDISAIAGFIFFVAIYCLLFRKANERKVRGWNTFFNKYIKNEEYDFTNSEAAIVFDGENIILTSQFIFNDMQEKNFESYLEKVSAQTQNSLQKILEQEKIEKKEKRKQELKEFKKDLKDLGGIASEVAQAAYAENKAKESTINNSSDDNANSHDKGVFIQVYKSSYWETHRNLGSSDPNYVSHQLSIVKNLNPDCRVRAVCRDTGRTIDVA